MSLSVKALFDEYPLPGCAEPELYQEQIEIRGSFLNLVGLSTQSMNFPEVTASAAGLSSNATENDPLIYTRAYFELLERTSILAARKTHSAELFLTSTEPEIWTYSKSNGIAAHAHWESACRSAKLELMERDAVLRSWYFGIHPISLGIPAGLRDSNLRDLYHLEAYRFQSSVNTVGVFGFPNEKGLPLFFGFGAHEDLEGAKHHAIQEAYQRLGFTWGEPLPEGPILNEPTPMYHLNYYLIPENAVHIQRWLNGSLPPRGEAPSLQKSHENIQFVDLTPEHLKGKCAVVKAVSEEFMPLTFGNWHPWIGPQSGPDLFPHPIS